MNERMLEIAKQAGLKKDHASDREYIGDFDWRLFGDLIIRECADILDKQIAPSNHPMNSLGHKLKEHLGVK
jgi:hypothetical protein